MSYDFFIFNFGGTTPPAPPLKDNGPDGLPLGSINEVKARLKKCYGSLKWDDHHFGMLAPSKYNYVIEFHLADRDQADIVRSIACHTQPDEMAFYAIAKICKANKWAAYDPQTSQWMNIKDTLNPPPPPPEVIKQIYIDRFIKELGPDPQISPESRKIAEDFFSDFKCALDDQSERVCDFYSDDAKIAQGGIIITGASYKPWLKKYIGAIVRSGQKPFEYDFSDFFYEEKGDALWIYCILHNRQRYRYSALSMEIKRNQDQDWKIVKSILSQ